MTTPLYVTAGQSNGVRIERYEGFEEYAEREGIDAAFLHTSVGGTGLAPLENRPDWYPLDDAGPNAGELYGAMLDEINALLETGAYHLAGIFWLQDGADATPALSLPYEERFQALVDSLIVEFGTEFTFTIAEASEVTPRYLNLLQTEGEDAAAKVAALEAIQAAQVSVAAATEQVTIINTVEVWTEAGVATAGADGTLSFAAAFEDPVHYSDQGADAMAAAFLDQFYGEDGEDGGGAEEADPSEDLGEGISVERARLIAYLYEAGLDRDGEIDLEGLNFWIDEAEGGLSDEEIATAFLASAEFDAAFGDPFDTADPRYLDDSAFVTTLYENVLDRAPDETGRDFWVEVLEEPSVSRADLLLSFATSAEGQAMTPVVETLIEVAPGEWAFVA